jgi:hypothetical protein
VGTLMILVDNFIEKDKVVDILIEIS